MAINQGLQKTVQLGLMNPPENYEERVEAWAKQLWEGRRWVQYDDTERIAVAFHVIGDTQGWFPPPVEFLKALPHRTRQETTPAPPSMGFLKKFNSPEFQELKKKFTMTNAEYDRYKARKDWGFIQDGEYRHTAKPGG